MATNFNLKMVKNRLANKGIWNKLCSHNRFFLQDIFSMSFQWNTKVHYTTLHYTTRVINLRMLNQIGNIFKGYNSLRRILSSLYLGLKWMHEWMNECSLDLTSISRTITDPAAARAAFGSCNYPPPIDPSSVWIPKILLQFHRDHSKNRKRDRNRSTHTVPAL